MGKEQNVERNKPLMSFDLGGGNGGVPRYWRTQEQRYMGGESKDFEIEFVEGTNVEGELFKALGVRSHLFQREWWLVASSEDKEAVAEFGKEVRQWMELKKFNQEVIVKVLFETSLIFGKGGEGIIRGAYDGEVDEVVHLMKESGYSMEDVTEWLFSVNGYMRERSFDQKTVEKLVLSVFEE